MISVDFPTGTITSDQARQVRRTLGLDNNLYSPTNSLTQFDSTYAYFGRQYLDNTGYIASRRLLSTQELAGEITGTGTLPADLTILTYD